MDSSSRLALAGIVPETSASTAPRGEVLAAVVEGPAAGRIDGRASLAKRVFQWGFFPASLVGGVAAMAWALAHGLGEQAAIAIPLALFGPIYLAERLLPWDARWNELHDGDVKADLLSIGVVALGLETVFKAVGPVAALAILKTLKLPATWHAIPSSWPFALQCVVVVLFIEFAKYWVHRVGHETHFWWPLHSVHHAVKRVYFLNGFRIHPVYHLLTYVVGYFPCLVLGASPDVLLVHAVLLGIGGAFQHANIDLRFGPLSYVFNTNEIHRWHHSTRIEEGNKNYGAILSIYDVVFRTYYNVPGRSPKRIGMVHERGYPIHDYLAQLAIPWTYKTRVGPEETPDE